MTRGHGIQELALEEVMGDRFGRYSKYIIQERALPDIRDGLKPVQRRILYAMAKDGNTHDKAFRKSAKTVGNVIGNYHPHGDTSVYDAMVRMSQEWKMREPLITMHGNNGSMDGDPPAAMRYTEARLSKIAKELLTDIEKETVEFVLNFDDTDYEPTVLPASYPNLLVNGATGISAGYATDIPPHNLGEVIDATIHLIDYPNAELKSLLKYVKGPDFPTGGIIQGKKALEKAYSTGRGRVVVRSKTSIEKMRGGREMIVVHEIPYDMNKSQLVRKIDDIRINKKIDGIAEVRDETDRDGLRIVIELKKDANAEGILTYLLKNTDLQVSYNFNMIAIDHQKPEQVGLIQILKSYIEHKKDVISRRSRFLLNKAENRAHIVSGLIKAISILDEVIQTIRESNNKAHAKINLINAFSFTEKQAEAIVNLQLYRLTNTDITALEKEKADLESEIASLKLILSDETALEKVMKSELRQVKKEYATPRLTEIEAEIEELKVEKEVLVTEEEVVVTVSREGYLKRSSIRSFASSDTEEAGVREGDQIVYAEKLTTLGQLIIFTSKGNVINRPVHEIPEARWKDVGVHLSQSLNLLSDEKIISAYGFEKIPNDKKVLFLTADGYAKLTEISEFQPRRSYKSQTYQAIKLKDDDDVVVMTELVTEEMENGWDIALVSRLGFGLRFHLSEISTYGPNAAGVIAMNLKDGDQVIGGMIFASDTEQAEAILITQRSSLKKMNFAEMDVIARARRGLTLLRKLKANPHQFKLFIPVTDTDELIEVISENGEIFKFQPKDYQNADRLNNGSFIFDENRAGEPLLYNRNLENLFSVKQIDDEMSTE